MALVAHYRLDGNANDALGKHNGTASGVTWVDGKLGQAGSFTAASNVNITSIDIPSTASFCAWAYMTDAASNQMIFSTDRAAGGGCDVFFSDGVISWNTGDGIANPFKNNGVNVPYPSLNTWHHYAVVNDIVRNKAILYLDGSYYGEATWRDTLQTNRRFIIGNYNSSTSYAWRGLIDDVRIYDHALSEREVKDLSLGKLLHYDFDHFQEPTENKVTSNSPTWNAWSGFTGTSVAFSEGDISGVKLTGTAGGGVRWRTSNSIQALPDTTYTVSAMMKWIGTYPHTNFFYLRQYNSAGSQVEERGVFLTTGLSSAQWHSVSETFTTRSDCASFIIDGYQYTAPCDIWCGNLQVEQKPHATPFVNGTRTGTVRDSSSQGNDAPLALANTPKWVEAGQIGKGAYEFDNTGQHWLSIPKNFAGLSDFTVSAWINPKGSHKNYNGTIISSGNWNAAHWAFGVSKENNAVVSRGPVSSYNHIIPLNEWSHLVWTKEPYGSSQEILRVYVNGTEIGNRVISSKTILSSSDSTTKIGADTYTIPSYFAFNGQIDDVRMYATALTADEVKELYQQRASVDSQGNLIC